MRSFNHFTLYLFLLNAIFKWGLNDEMFLIIIDLCAM